MSFASEEEIRSRFQCQKTGACCRKPGYVYLREGEADAIASQFPMDVREFLDTKTLLLDRRQIVLKKHPDESCIFLAEGQCSIYKVRPGQCRDFPFTWRTEASWSYCLGLKRLLS